MIDWRWAIPTISTQPSIVHRHSFIPIVNHQSAFNSSHRHAQLDARRRVLARRDGEKEARAVRHAGRDSNPQQVAKELRAGAAATPAVFGPRLTAAATLSAGAADRHFERHGRAGHGLSNR
jgi:hypothetical protein